MTPKYPNESEKIREFKFSTVNKNCYIHLEIIAGKIIILNIILIIGSNISQNQIRLYNEHDIINRPISKTTKATVASRNSISCESNSQIR